MLRFGMRGKFTTVNIICILAFFYMVPGCVKWVHPEGLGYEALKADRRECEREAVEAVREKFGEELCKDYSVDTAREVYDYSSEDRYPQFIRNEIFMRSRRDMQRSFNDCVDLRQKAFNDCMEIKGWRPAK